MMKLQKQFFSLSNSSGFLFTIVYVIKFKHYLINYPPFKELVIIQNL